MGNMATNVYVKFNCDRLRIDEALENWKSDNKKKKDKNNVHSAWGTFPGSKSSVPAVQLLLLGLNRDLSESGFGLASFTL